MLTEVARGVHVRQSAFSQSNAVVIRGSSGALLVDPGISGDELEELGDDLDSMGIVATMGFSTHPHWDHLLWHERFGDVARYGTAKCVETARARLAGNREKASRLAPGAPLDTLDAVTGLQPGATELPWRGRAIRLLEHDAHAPGHAALFVEDVRVLIAGDMLSDVEMPLFDARGADPCGDYVIALDLLASVPAEVVIPGHGSVGFGTDIGSRIEADRAYVRALRDGIDPVDSRVESDATYGADWLPEAHQDNVELARQRSNVHPVK